MLISGDMINYSALSCSEWFYVSEVDLLLCELRLWKGFRLTVLSVCMLSGGLLKSVPFRVFLDYGNLFYAYSKISLFLTNKVYVGINNCIVNYYSQLSPCWHPIITDTRYYGQNAALHLAKSIYRFFLHLVYRGLIENDSRSKLHPVEGVRYNKQELNIECFLQLQLFLFL